jgi:hypothetical protein
MPEITYPYLNPSVWGPHYWFFLHTIAISYPSSPNAITKKKYYDFFHTLPLFIPTSEISKEFELLLVKYPVSVYLGSKEQLVQWVHFIHNQINEKLETPTITMDEFYVQYFSAYKDTSGDALNYIKWKCRGAYIGLMLFIVGLIYYLM